MNDIRQKLEDEVLPFVRKPARYIGGEINASARPRAEVKLLLSYPDVYEVGMSHLGLRLLYDIVNRLEWAGAERAFAAWGEMEALLKEKGIPLYSLETFTPAAEFDIWGFSLQAELTYTNILAMLDLAGLPVKAEDRSWPGSPLVLGGGAGTTNPEPLADFFDLFLIGDGEEAIVEIMAAYRELVRGGRGEGMKKEELLKALVERVPGLYAPVLYRPLPERGGPLAPVSPKVPARVARRKVDDLNRTRIENPILPVTEVVHDRAVVEVMRGCKRGCRFCQASWINRPVREKEAETVIEEARRLVEASGWEEVSLLSLSSGDYRGIEKVMNKLSPELAARHVSLSLPSLNVESVDKKIFEEIKRVRKSGVTMAPEAAGKRLQGVINKKLDPDLLWEIGRELKAMGWRLIKLYFMIGLPTERREDVEAIAETIDRFSRWGGQLNVTVSNFVPKPGTPFQWAPMAGEEEIKEKQKLIRDRVRSRRVNLKFRPAPLSRIEAILARGGREVGRALQAAWEAGCRFDGWEEGFSYRKWLEALRRAGIDPDESLKSTVYETPLPWSHIEAGVSNEILVKEAKKAMEKAE